MSSLVFFVGLQVTYWQAALAVFHCIAANDGLITCLPARQNDLIHAVESNHLKQLIVYYLNLPVNADY